MSTSSDDAVDFGAYSAENVRFGGVLRSLRQAKHLSLQDVGEQTSGEFKASVVGAYERGERVISVPRLRRLAAFYGADASELVKGDDHFVFRAEVHVGVSGSVSFIAEFTEAIMALGRPGLSVNSVVVEGLGLEVGEPEPELAHAG